MSQEDKPGGWVADGKYFRYEGWDEEQNQAWLQYCASCDEVRTSRMQPSEWALQYELKRVNDLMLPQIKKRVNDLTRPQTKIDPSMPNTVAEMEAAAEAVKRRWEQKFAEREKEKAITERLVAECEARKPEAASDASVTDVITMWNEELAALSRSLDALATKLILVLQPGESPVYSGEPIIAPGGQVPWREGQVPVVSMLLTLYGRIEHITETVNDLNNRVRI